LNLVLWLAQPLPENCGINNILYRAGFTVYAIAPLLAPPPDLALKVQQHGIDCQESAKPDVILENNLNRKFAFIECKSDSFGIGSSNARQARCLMLVSGERGAEALALTVDEMSSSILMYLLPDARIELLNETLSALDAEFSGLGFPKCNFSYLGLITIENNIGISINQSCSYFFGLEAGQTRLTSWPPDTDPRPLYFIPYDPDINQTVQERDLCRRILYERMQSTVIAAIGRADPPINITMKPSDIMNDAMCGLFEQWENRESKTHLIKICKSFMTSLIEAVNSVAPDSFTYSPGIGWNVYLIDDNQKESVLDALTRFSPETLELEVEPEPGLFDEFED
jgi:hypothetical protein